MRGAGERDRGRTDERHWGLARQTVLACVLVAVAVAGGYILPAAAASRDSDEAVSAARITEPKEIQYLCARKSDGVLRYVKRPGKCDERSQKALEISESRPVYACANRSSGEPVRRVSNLRDCSSKETGFTLPPENEAVRFCASERTGWLRRVSSMGVCRGRAGIPVFVAPTNEAPVADDDTYEVDEDETLNVTAPGVLDGDTDADNDPLTAAKVSDPSDGQLTLDADGSFDYAPNADFNGEDSFTYEARDGQGGEGEATVTITVRPINAAPVATDGAENMNEDGEGLPIDFGALVSDEETAVDDLDYTIVNGPSAAQGELTGNGPTFTFDSADDFNGMVAIDYKVTDRGDPDDCQNASPPQGCDAPEESATKAVTITVGAVNDPPTFDILGNQTAGEDSGTNGFHEVSNFLTNLSPGPPDEVGQNVTLSVANDNNDLFTANGQPAIDQDTGKLTYTLKQDASGEATVTVTATDSGADTTPNDNTTGKTFKITVSADNDAPTVAFDNPPTSADEGETKTFAFTVTDPDPGDTFTVKNGFPDCGTGGELVDDSLDTEAPDYSFECRFADGPANPDVRIQVADSTNADSNVATQSVAVANVKPSISLSGPDKADEGDTEEYTFTITDPGDDELTITADCGAEGAEVNTDGEEVEGVHEYDPVTGEGSFRCLFPDGPATTNVTATVTDSDGDADTDNQLVEVTVDNVAPTVENQSVSTDEDTEKTITLSATDPAGTNDPPTFTIVSLPENGTLYEGANTSGSELTSPGEISGNEVTYKPDADYNNTVDNPDTFTYKANDGDADSNTATVSITVDAVNDAPTLDLDNTTDGNDSTATFDEPGPGVALAPNAAVADIDNANLATATVTLTDRPDGDDESLSADAGATGIEVAYASGVLTLTAPTDGATVDQFEQVLQTVEYDNTAAPPDRDDRIVEFTVNDGDLPSDVATSTVTVVPLNVPPVVDLNGASDGIDTTASFTEGGGPVALAPDTIVSDPNDQELFSATITLTNPLDENDESLSAGSSGPINATPYDSSTGVLKFTGTNLVSQYEALLRTVTYSNSSDAPNDTPRVVTFVVNDQKDDSVVATSTVSITPTNDAPTVETSNFSPSFTEGGSPTLIDDGFTVTDPDDTSLASATVQVTDGFQTGKDVLSFTDQNGIIGAFSGDTLTLTGPAGIADWEDALSSITFSTTSQAPGTSRTVSVKVDDGDEESAAATKTITVVPVNNAPNLTQPDNALTYTEDTPSENHQLAIAPNLTVSDADSTNIQSATVEITDGYQNGEDFLSFATANGISGSFDATGGALTLTHASGTKTVAEYETALRNVKYHNTSENPNVATRTVSFVANDGDADGDAVTRDITVVRTNDAPVITFSPDGPINGATNSGIPITGLSFSDVDAGNASVYVTLTRTTPNGGAFTLRTDVTDGLAAEDITDNDSGEVQILAPLAKINATLSADNGLLYENSVEGSHTFDIHIADQGNTGEPGARSDFRPKTIIVDAPPSVTSTTPASTGSPTDVNPTANITINFSESVNATAASFELKCPSTGTARSLAVTGSGSNSIALNPDTDLPATTVCQVRVVANQVTDTDGNDPPDNMVAEHTFTFTTAPKAVADDYKDLFTVVGNVSYDSQNSSPVRSVLDNDEKDGSTTVATSDTTSAQGGNVTVRPNGTFTYNPPAGYEGLDTFTYTVNGGSTATVTLRVGGMIWFVNNNSGACSSNCDGRLSNPFNTLGTFNTANNGTGNNPAAGDNVFVYESSANYTGPVTLLNSQRLIGQDAGDSLTTITSLTRPSGSAPYPTMNTSGNKATITTTAASTNGVNVASANTLRGFTVGDTTGSDINGSSFGTLRALDVSLTGAGQALNLSTGTLTGAGFDTLTSTSGTNNVSLTNVATSGGAFNLSANTTTPGALSGAGSNAFFMSGGTGSFSYSGTVSNTNSQAVNITNKEGGTVTLSGDINPSGGSNAKGIRVFLSQNATINFSGANKKISTDLGAGVSLSSNFGSTINFTNGGLAITGTGTATGLSATDGTVKVSGTGNTISTASGTALNVANTTIGAGASGEGGLNFRSISAGNSSSGPTNGIVLDTTGSTAGLTVTGDGGTGQGGNSSGGTIQKTTGGAISLTNTKSPSFNNITIQNPARSGVRGTGVTNFSITNSTIENAGESTANLSAPLDFALAFNNDPAGGTKNIEGTLTVTNNKLLRGYAGGLKVIQKDGTIDNATITNNLITQQQATDTPGDGIGFNLNGTTSAVASLTKATITGNTLTNLRGSGILLLGGNSSTSTAPSGTYGVPTGNPGTGTDIIDISNNSIVGGAKVGSDVSPQMQGPAIEAGYDGRGQANIKITNNGTMAQPIQNFRGIGIGTGSSGSGTGDYYVTGNFVQPNSSNDLNSTGIGIGADKNQQADNSTLYNPTVNAVIANNTVTNSNGFGIRSLVLDSNARVNLQLQNNNVGAPADRTFPSIGIESGNGTDPSRTATTCAQVSGNIAAAGSGPDSFGDTTPGIIMRERAAAVLGIVGLNNGSSAATAESFEAGLNSGSGAGAGSPSFAGKKVAVFTSGGSPVDGCSLGF